MDATTNKRLARFYEGFVAGLNDVHADWRSLPPREQKLVFKKVEDAAKEIVTGERDGSVGLSPSTFSSYVRTVKRALLFDVPLEIAVKATNQQLLHAQYHVREQMKGEKGTHQEKMVRAYQYLRARHFRSN